ncbi:GFA family protein [Rhizobium sp. TH2]|uniref:GFA family protein n=1 Tax=Rhizobium sp. TH2 TaxID=2775403 RepID=UPI002157B487|nr:GFA family protein [Rhizobium sp. TH2]UVC10591.1 GFA family protein [Rhizobium sp. TH2]
MSFSGGCQCGAVRYRAAKAPSEPHLCHCRMCQKAAGNYFMPLGGVMHEDFEITRGEVAWFHSSDIVRRGFCAHCGTPLIYETIGGEHVAITLGSLDRPQDVPPVAHSDAYARMPWFDALFSLPEEGAKDATDGGGEHYQEIRNSNHQHPDHDTSVWPEENEP